MIKFVKGDILDAKEKIIAQQVNCMGVMGSGLARSIREKYPEVYESYKVICNRAEPTELLGRVQVIFTDNKKIIASIFGQLSYGRDKQYTDYKALEEGLKDLASMSKRFGSVAIPYGIGCGLGGGDWNVVSDMIEEILKDCNVTIYRKE